MELSVVHGALLAITAIAALTDTRTGHIPNWLTLPMLALAPLAHFATGGVAGAVFSLAGVVVCGSVPLVVFIRGGMGGGDVKIFAALGAIAGPRLALEAQLYAFVAASLFALGLLAYRGALWRTFASFIAGAFGSLLPPRWRRERPPELRMTLRLGLAIFVGTLAAVLASSSERLS